MESRKHKQATGSFVKKNISLKLMNKKEGIPYILFAQLAACGLCFLFLSHISPCCLYHAY